MQQKPSVNSFRHKLPRGNMYFTKVNPSNEWSHTNQEWHYLFMCTHSFVFLLISVNPVKLLILHLMMLINDTLRCVSQPTHWVKPRSDYSNTPTPQKPSGQCLALPSAREEIRDGSIRCFFLEFSLCLSRALMDMKWHHCLYTSILYKWKLVLLCCSLVKRISLHGS